MTKIAVFITISLYLQGSTGKPKQNNWCPTGVIGPACSDYAPCKSGFTCDMKAKRCCRDPVCPVGWLEGESCRLTVGQEKCPEGYMCMPNNFCCRSQVCPSGSIGPACVSDKDCNPGDKCREGYCCVHPRCPNGWIEGKGVCDFTTGRPRCPTGFDCTNDFCCKNPNYCPQEKKGVKCPYGTCENGYDCKNGYCCLNY